MLCNHSTDVNAITEILLARSGHGTRCLSETDDHELLESPCTEKCLDVLQVTFNRSKRINCQKGSMEDILDDRSTRGHTVQYRLLLLFSQQTVPEALPTFDCYHGSVSGLEKKVLAMRNPSFQLPENARRLSLKGRIHTDRPLCSLNRFPRETLATENHVPVRR